MNNLKIYIIFPINTTDREKFKLMPMACSDYVH